MILSRRVEKREGRRNFGHRKKRLLEVRAIPDEVAGHSVVDEVVDEVTEEAIDELLDDISDDITRQCHQGTSTTQPRLVGPTLSRPSRLSRLGQYSQVKHASPKNAVRHVTVEEKT